MAIYHFEAKVISRGKGQSAIASASYRSGEKLYSERYNKFNFYGRSVAPKTFILKPSNAPDWTLNRQKLWNEVEKIEKSKNARLARDFILALPSELNEEELLYAATLTSDPAKQEAIYTQATKQFPNDYRGYNNLGKLAYQAGNIDKAESYFKKAASVNATPEVNMNLGLISLMKGDKAAAEAYFGKAAGTKELGESMGNLYIAQGQYERAVNSFGDSKTNSAALAQILAKDYNKAKNTLANVERPDAYTDYLMAVLGARTNNSSMVTSSLKSAVAKDSSLAKKAATDLEFAKYFTNADFMSIVK